MVFLKEEEIDYLKVFSCNHTAITEIYPKKTFLRFLRFILPRAKNLNHFFQGGSGN